MRGVIAALLVLAACLALGGSGCGGPNPESTPRPTPKPTPTASATPTPTAEPTPEPSPQTNVIHETDKLTASDAADDDRFGGSVSISGDIVVVGAALDDDAGAESGSAHVFHRGPDSWGEKKKLTASDGAAGSYFGAAVSVSGDTVVVGALGPGRSPGSAYVFYRDQGGPNNWGERKKLTASDAEPGDGFGGAVSASGDVVVVGAQHDDHAGAESGSAYVFHRNQGGPDNWGQVAKLHASDGAARDWFGNRVCVSGDIAVVGAVCRSDAGQFSGAVYVFSRHEGGSDHWGQIKKLTAADAAEFQYFGESVSASGDIMVVGASIGFGTAYVFYRNQGGSNNWGEVKKLTVPHVDGEFEFGSSVSVAGDIAVVGGGFYFSGDFDQFAGAAYAFYRHAQGTDNWGQVAKLSSSDFFVSDCYGCSISVSGHSAVVGAPRANAAGRRSSGSAYVFSVPSILAR